jgi:hypothetical protein
MTNDLAMGSFRTADAGPPVALALEEADERMVQYLKAGGVLIASSTIADEDRVLE